MSSTTTTTTTTSTTTASAVAPSPAAGVEAEDADSAHQAIIQSREREREHASRRAAEREQQRLMNQTPMNRIALLSLCRILTILTLVINIMFYGIPFIILIVFYYCCTRNPIPAQVLFRNLLSGDPDLWNSHHPQHRQGASQCQWTENEIRAAVIRRELVETVVLPQEGETSAASSSAMPPPRPGSNVLNNRTVPTTIWLESLDGMRLYLFTAPLPFLPSSSSASTEDADTNMNIHTNTTTMSSFSGSVSGTSAVIAPATVAAAAAPGITSTQYLPADIEEDDPDAANTESSPLPSPSDQQHEHVDFDSDNNHDNNEIMMGNQDVETGVQVAPQEDNANINHNDDDVEELHPHGSSCDICLCSYQPGDTVAWSRNVDCPHYFHEDCITDWLRRKRTCCSCRRDYLAVPVPVPAEIVKPPDGAAADEHV